MVLWHLMLCYAVENWFASKILSNERVISPSLPVYHAQWISENAPVWISDILKMKKQLVWKKINKSEIQAKHIKH